MKKSGEKFTEKYGVESATIYKDAGMLERLRIPGPKHPLYDPTALTEFDPIQVAEIGAEGKMTDPIECWTDPDEGVMWVLDGRSRFLAVQEVNRRRATEGRELVKPYIVPFNGDEKAAIARVRIKNYHRRIPTPSGMAIDLKILRDAGWSWAECAIKLHVETTDAEQWGRKLMPMAFCVAEVRDAIDKGELPRTVASRFGGTALDGSKALGKKEQATLLAELLADKATQATAPKSRAPLTPKLRERVKVALTNGASEKLRGDDREIAKIVAATLARVDGDSKALKSWPEVAEIVENALKSKTKEKNASKDA